MNPTNSERNLEDAGRLHKGNDERAGDSGARQDGDSVPFKAGLALAVLALLAPGLALMVACSLKSLISKL